MFKLSGVLRKVGIGASVAASIAAFFWTYAGGYAAANYGWITVAALLKKAAISAGVAGLAGLAVTAVLAVGLFALRKKLKQGKNSFIAW